MSLQTQVMSFPIKTLSSDSYETDIFIPVVHYYFLISDRLKPQTLLHLYVKRAV